MRSTCVCLVLPLLLAPIAAAQAEVVVIANRTERAVRFRVSGEGAESEIYTVEAGDLAVVPTVGSIRLAYRDGTEPARYSLAPNCAYYFGEGEQGGVLLRKIGLRGTERTAAGTGIADRGRFDVVGTITVRILVDDDERAARQRWETRLRDRVEDASQILEKHCRMRLKVVETGGWNSDNRIKEFEKSLAEFEREVEPGDAQLAIGFTSQYEVPKGRTHLGGTRGPFHRHILIREWSQHITEAERIEVLVHELGHVLGAAHSADENSVMRPSLGDRKARSIEFRIGYDPANTLAMNLISEEMRFRGARRWSDLTPATIRRLKQVYAAMEAALPGDPAAKKYQALLGQASLVALAPGTRKVLAELRRAAQENANRPPANSAETDEQSRLTGDRLMDDYVRRAAWAARDLPAADAPAQFLIALGIAVDDSKLLAQHPSLRLLHRAVETETQRKTRRAAWGNPTMRGRDDLAKHFLVSAYLMAALGRRTAEAAGLGKELLDIQQGSGLSFADLAADHAGVVFAEHVLAGEITMLDLASEFSVEDFLPSLEGLPEGITLQTFLLQFGSPTDGRFAEVLKDIRGRLDALPPYRGELDSPQDVER